MSLHFLQLCLQIHVLQEGTAVLEYDATFSTLTTYKHAKDASASHPCNSIDLFIVLKVLCLL